jgi:alginate O-acetyltransferase complex protein AlgI
MSIQYVIVLLGLFLVSFASRFIAATKPRQWLLLIASYFMYAELASPAFLALLIASSVMNFAWGVWLRRRPTPVLLWAATGSNILLLGFFKYLPPLSRLWYGSLSQPGFIQRIILPLGVSFWTFQALSYLFDTYFEEELDPSLLEFCMYMAFWPTVSLGPVCRLPKMLPQFRKIPGSLRRDLSVGVVRLVEGLFMKAVLAQLLAAGLTRGGGISAGFDAVAVQRSALDVWTLAIGYGFQLFFDFAGYSNIAIGVARLAGIRLEENFNRPYLATRPAEFWTRWHMSLSFWIRDYLYLPLSTLRRERWWGYTALVITMVTFGLWHDAKATLLLWGLYHGVVLVCQRIGDQLFRALPYGLPDPFGRLIGWGATFMTVCLSYVFFRANSLAQALQMLRSVLKPGSYSIVHSTLHRDDYLLVSSIVLGYFAYAGLSRLLLLWRQYCRRHESGRGPASLVKRGAVRGALRWVVLISQAIEVRKWWVLIPVLTFLLAIVGMSFLENSNIAPFVYRHF